jgi:hypothetical protein
MIWTSSKEGNMQKSLKSSAKELIDGIGTESERDLRIIKLIYGFVRTGFLESRADRGGAA